MHGAAFFCFGPGRGGADGKNFGVGRGREKILRARRVTVKLGAFSGWGGAGQGSLENYWDQGSHFPRGRGGAGRASLLTYMEMGEI